jgi:hypothetical protein
VTTDGDTTDVIWPDYVCLLDGSPIATGNITNSARAYWKHELCTGTRIPEGNHTLQVNLSGREGVNTWVDTIEYHPSPGADISGWLRVDAPDENISYSSGWDRGAGLTHSNGATLTYNFIGESSTP